MKLLIREPGSDQTSSLVASATEFTSASIGYVEARSALGKAARAGRLSPRRQGVARAKLHEIWAEMTVVDLDDELVTAAGDVIRRRETIDDLLAFDSSYSGLSSDSQDTSTT